MFIVELIVAKMCETLKFYLIQKILNLLEKVGKVLKSLGKVLKSLGKILGFHIQ